MRTETLVLVVEDEILVRSAAVEMLEEAGYSTLEAASADQAIQMLETNPDIRLVFTDVNMPGSMDGVRLTEVINKRWPPVRLVVTSGMPRPGDLPHGTSFLTKPYVWSGLSAALQNVLDRA